MTQTPTKWAERKDKLFITVESSNATDVKVNFTENSVSLTGSGITAKSSDVHPIQVNLALFKNIVPAQSSFKVIGPSIQILCIKADAGYWEKLVNEPNSKTKGWLSVDWNLWKDEDEEKADEQVNFGGGGAGGYGDMSNMMNMMQGGGMGGMGGMDMSALQGMGGMGGMGGADSDDEEEEEGAPAADLKDLE
jgi:cytosolic prostaglandin-E synthase